MKKTRHGIYVTLGPDLAAEVRRVAAAVGVEPGQVIEPLIRRHLRGGSIADDYVAAVGYLAGLLVKPPSEELRPATEAATEAVFDVIETESAEPHAGCGGRVFYRTSDYLDRFYRCQKCGKKWTVEGPDS